MPDDLIESSTKRRSLLLGGAIGIFGTALLGFAAFTICDFLNAVARRAPIIMWDEGGWIALPIALALLAAALALFIGRNHGLDIFGPRSDAIKSLLTLSACLLPFVIVFPLSMHWLAGQYLESRGYTACGEMFWIATDRMPGAEAAQARCEALRRG